MDIEVKQIQIQIQTQTQNNINNKIFEQKNTTCDLEDASSDEELFEEFQKIIKSKKPHAETYGFNNY